MKRRILSFILLISMLVCAACNTSESGNKESETVKEENITEKATETEAETEPDLTREAYDYDYDGSAIGTGIGVNPGRVVWGYDDDLFTWDGNGLWWNESNYDEAALYTLLEESICALAGKEDITSALDALFINFNERVNGVSEGYKKGQKIAIKGNMNVTSSNDESDTTTKYGYFPAPLTIKSLLLILVRYGVEPSDITFYDTSRSIPDFIRKICTTGELQGVNIASFYADNSVCDTTKPILWSHDFSSDNWSFYNGYPTVNPTYYPTFVTEATYLINLFNLRGHTLAGFTASAKNHFGSIMPGYTTKTGLVLFPDGYRINPPIYAGVHHYIAARDYIDTPSEIWNLPMREFGTYNCLVDLMSNADCGGKTFLYICDALASTVTQGSILTNSEKFYSTPFGVGSKNGTGWTNSYFVSQDPVAIDSVCLDFLLREQRVANSLGDTKWNSWLIEGGTAENYLIEAALADNPPSGTLYQDGYGNPVSSLGVHERWNNDTDMNYSRNLGKDEGIELYRVIK